jgi:thymidylate synthase
MKNILLTTSFILMFSVSIQAQTKEVTENMQAAIQKNGVELFENGAVKVKVDVSRIDAYYKWAASADTLYAFNAEISWDKESLRDYEEMYSSMDLAEVGAKYQNWLKAISSDVQYASTGKSKYKIDQRY